MCLNLLIYDIYIYKNHAKLMRLFDFFLFSNFLLPFLEHG